MEGDVIQLSDVFAFDWDAGSTKARFQGIIQPTGLRPSFSKHLHDVGVELPANMFGDPESLLTRVNRR